jgi:hypothetical protein
MTEQIEIEAFSSLFWFESCQLLSLKKQQIDHQLAQRKITGCFKQSAEVHT